MVFKSLKPQPLREKYFSNIEKEINAIFYRMIYEPLARALGLEEIKNSTGPADPLVSAIRSGKVWYQDGVFYGSYNAQISKRLREIGAKFRPSTRTWSYKGALPADISVANAHAAAAYETLRDRIVQTLGKIDIDKVNDISEIPDELVRSIRMIDTTWTDTVKSISIPPDLTDIQVGNLAASWGQNLDLYIKNWLSDNIIELRSKVMDSAFSGGRAAGLEKMIRDNYGVSRNKARFLARQETSLLMSKFHEERYKDVGINSYKWQGALDERERPDHKALEGQVFNWDSPPVVDRKTGRRAHPGEDFGCRCVAIPLIK